MAEDEGEGKMIRNKNKIKQKTVEMAAESRRGWQPGQQFSPGTRGSHCRIQTEKDSILES